MTKAALVKSLSAWAGTALAPGGEHCFQRRPSFRIPGAGPVDLLTVRHTVPPAAGAPPSFAVGLWMIEDRAVEERDLDGMTRRFHAFKASYFEFLEHAETQGFSPLHRITVTGHLVGRSVRRSPLIDLLSHWGPTLCFWTWRWAGGGMDVTPWYAKAPPMSGARAQLKALLPHLPWKDSGAAQDESDARLQRRTARFTTPR